MENNNVKPLYKLLNEKRLLGEWVADDKCIINKEYDVKVPFNYGIESTADIEYTALAVNNLASLAEALEEITIAYEACAKLLTSYQNPTPPILLKAKEALNKIS